MRHKKQMTDVTVNMKCRPFGPQRSIKSSSTPSRAWLLTTGPSGPTAGFKIEDWTLEASNYLSCGVAAEVGCTDGFGRGGLVAVGIGGGGPKSTDFVGEGSGEVAGFPVFEFSFALLLAFWFAPPMSIGLPLGTGEAETFALALAFAVWLIVPPAGMPASAAPVGGFACSTGLLLGSAVRGEPVGVAPVGCELRENA